MLQEQKTCINTYFWLDFSRQKIIKGKNKLSKWIDII